MSYTLEILQIAEIEFEESILWYERIHPTLAERFKQQVKAAINRVINAPLTYARISQNVRRAVVDHFPYNVYFFMKDDTVVVFGIMHSKRSPTLWRNRIH